MYWKKEETPDPQPKTPKKSTKIPQPINNLQVKQSAPGKTE